MEATSLRFAAAARVLGDVARRSGLVAPGYRSPPRRRDVPRTIRRARGGVTVAIAVRGRPWAAVLADMVDGLCLANGLRGADSAAVREAAWAALAVADPAADPAAGGARSVPIVDRSPARPGSATIGVAARVA